MQPEYHSPALLVDRSFLLLPLALSASALRPLALPRPLALLPPSALGRRRLQSQGCRPLRLHRRSLLPHRHPRYLTIAPSTSERRRWLTPRPPPIAVQPAHFGPFDQYRRHRFGFGAHLPSDSCRHPHQVYLPPTDWVVVGAPGSPGSPGSPRDRHSDCPRRRCLDSLAADSWACRNHHQSLLATSDQARLPPAPSEASRARVPASRRFRPPAAAAG